jgi:hypothetical protein
MYSVYIIVYINYSMNLKSALLLIFIAGESTISGLNYKQIILFKFIWLSMYLNLIKIKYIGYRMNLKGGICL